MGEIRQPAHYFFRLVPVGHATCDGRGRAIATMRFEPVSSPLESQPKSDKTEEHNARGPHHGPSPGAVDKMLGFAEARGANHAQAKQRTGPPTASGGRLDDERIEARAVIAGLQTAQHELDEAADVAKMPAQAIEAQRHLAHVLVSGKSYGATSEKEAVKRAADSFDQALHRFLARAKNSTREIEQLIDTNLRVRLQLGLAVMSPRASYHKQSGSDAAHAKLTLPRVLHLIAVRAEDAIAWLEQFPDENRNTVIAALSRDLDDSIGYAHFLIEPLSLAERQNFAPELDLAALRIGIVLRWVRTRTAHRAMETRFLKTVDTFDNVLRSAGAKPVAGRDAPALTERSQHAGEQEAAALSAAYGDFQLSLDKWGVRQTTAVGKFEQLAALKDNEDTPFVASLLRSVLVAALGHLGGYIIGAAATHAAGAMAKAAKMPLPQVTLPGAARAVSLSIPEVMPGEKVIQRVVDVTTDASQAIIDTAMATKTDQIARSRAIFAAGMQIDIVDRITKYKRNVVGMVSRSEVTPNQLRVTQYVLEALMDGVHDAYYTKTVEAWTSYVAQSRLGTNRNKENRRTVSKTKQYFGETTPGGRVTGTSKEGIAGVLRLEMKVHPAGAQPKLLRDRTKIVGMNSEVTKAVIENAGRRLNNVWLPKEVHVRTDYGHAIIAVNEKNEVGDVLDWSEVQRKVGIDSGEQFWRLWGKDIVLA